MKKIIFILLFLVTNISIASAQNDITTVFLSLPDAIIPGLEAEQKDKLIANPTDTAAINVETAIYSSIKRIAMSDNYISLQTSEAGTTQIKILPLINESKIICVIKTVCGSMCDSQIKFYTTKWIPIEGSELFPRKDINWFIKSDADRTNFDFINAYAALDIAPVKLTFVDKKDAISAEFDIKNYLSNDDYKKIQPYLIEGPRILSWDKISYK